MWIRVERQKRKTEEDEDETPQQLVLHSPDGNFTVYKRCSPVAKRWCSLSRVHSDKYHGEMVAPFDDEPTEISTDEIGFEFYQKCEGVEYGGEEGVELFRMTPLMYDDEYVSSQDSQDSNTEHYYTNDYPEDYWSD